MPLCELLPLRIELACRCVRFICKCLCSDNVVSAVARNGVYSSRAQSSVGRNAQFCCSLFKVPLHKLCAVNKQLGFSVANSSISDDCMYIINMIKELLSVKYQQFELSSSFFNRQDIDCMIDFFVYCLVSFFSFLLCTHVRFYNK